MTIFQRWLHKSGMMNQIRGRQRPQVPRFKQAPDYTGKLDQTLAYLADSVGESDDYMVRITEVNGRSTACAFVSTVCDPTKVEETMRAINSHQFPKRAPKKLVQYLIEHVLVGSDALFMQNLFEIREALCAGWLVILVDGTTPAIVIGAQKIEHRSPEQPFIESSSRGSQVSFVENIDVNIGLVRVGLTTDSLVVKKNKVGYRSRRNVAVLYMKDVANSVVVETVSRRIEALHLDMITDSAAIEQRISGHAWSLFPVTRATQRIDNVCREINQGKVAIVVDGDPTVLLVPATVQDFFQTQED